MRPTTKSLGGLLATMLLIGLGAAACKDNDWPVQGEGAPSIDNSINSQVLSFLADNGLPGATVAVTRNGRLVWSKAYGWANQDKQIRMKPWHRSRIGSVSKVITTIGLLQMLESNTGSPGGLIASSSLKTKLAEKVYGHPGTDFHHLSWPHVVEPTVLANPGQYWVAIRAGVQDLYLHTYASDMARMIEWASQVELGHLLSHTSGLLRSGNGPAAADFFGVDESELTYQQVHLGVLRAQVRSPENDDDLKCYLDGSLYVPDKIGDEPNPAFTGKVYQMPPFLYEPGTDRCYSNHGFGLVGSIMDELAGPGPDDTYRGVIERGVLQPLGLTNVVPNNADISELDAWPHGSALDPEQVVTHGLAAGGWSASAQDMARIMCGLDRGSNHLRLLKPATVTTMETIAYPAASSTQPLGWDWRKDQSLYKNGSVGGGESVIMKFLPGEFDTAPDDEINIAMNINVQGSLPSDDMLRSIAEKIAAADIPHDYDLFDPAHRCVVEPPLTAPTTGPTTPGKVVVTPGAGHPKPPTVLIRKPTTGVHPAPNGVASIDFAGAGADAAGKAIPGTYYRWTAVQGAQQTVLCAGSDIGPGTSPAPSPTTGGFTTRTDCSSFTRKLINKVPGTSPPILIRLEVRDPAGVIGEASVTIFLVTPPNH